MARMSRLMSRGLAKTVSVPRRREGIDAQMKNPIEWQARMESWESRGAVILRRQARDFMACATITFRKLLDGTAHIHDGNTGVNVRDLVTDTDAAMRILLELPGEDDMRGAFRECSWRVEQPVNALPPEPVPDAWHSLADRIRRWSNDRWEAAKRAPKEMVG